jgi:hypothetical protein
VQAGEGRLTSRPGPEAVEGRLAVDHQVVEEDGLLGGEVAEHRAPPDRRGHGDLVDRRLGVSLGGEQLEGRPGDAGAGLLRFSITVRRLGHGQIVPAVADPAEPAGTAGACR